MFSEWSSNEWGYGWAPICGHTDRNGVFIEVDPTLNIVVVIALGTERPSSWCASVDLDAALFLEGTPYETTVARTTDTLVWVSQDGRSDLCMDAGIGEELLAELRKEERTRGRIPDALSTILSFYRGTDAGELGALVDRFRAAEED